MNTQPLQLALFETDPAVVPAPTRSSRRKPVHSTPSEALNRRKPHPSSSGGRAARHGRHAEDIIARMLELQGYTIQRQVNIGDGIYGTPLIADFLVLDLPGFPNGLVIESKWQESQGSVDEKLPYLVSNIQTCSPYPTIVILHGGGFRPGAEAWLREQVDEEKLLAVFRLEEFFAWMNRLP